MNIEEKRKERRTSTNKKGAHICTEGTHEFFTPIDIVNDMLTIIDDWSDFSKTILEPSAGDGAFVVRIYEERIRRCKNINDVYKAISTIYATELMEDNVQIMKDNLKEIIFKYKFDIDEKICQIIDNNIVCTDIFKWDYENWCPIKNNELF